MLLRCSLTSIDSHRILHSTFCLVDVHLDVASIWVVTKFSYSSFVVRLLDDS